MRMAELSRTTGIATPTIKWYLREGLLPRGDTTKPNQAEYGDRHVRRLRLVRALTEVGGLPVAQTRAVTAALDDPSVDLAGVLKIAHGALSHGAVAPAAPEAAAVDAFLARRGWTVQENSPARDQLAAVVAMLGGLMGLPAGVAGDGPAAAVSMLGPYADAVERLALMEIGTLPFDEGRDAVVERVVVGTVLFERALGTLRRLAQEHTFAEALRAGTVPGS
jgi:DNA-binding transcriptional MerR regulator